MTAIEKPKSEQIYWVYILHCDNKTYYTGYTNDLNKRYRSHLEGTGKCKYTRSFKPLGIAQSWKITGNKSIAMQLERAIKKCSRSQKEALIAEPERALHLVPTLLTKRGKESCLAPFSAQS